MQTSEIQVLVDKVLREAKETTKFTREAILGGALTIEEYREQTGFLRGAETLCQILIAEAKKAMREQIGDQNDGQ